MRDAPNFENIKHNGQISKRKSEYLEKVLDSSKSIFENGNLSQEIKDKYNQILELLTDRKDEAEAAHLLGVHIKEKEGGTARTSAPQNTWEAQMLPTNVIEVEINSSMPEETKEALKGLWYYLHTEIENLKQGEDAKIGDYFTTDENGVVTNRLIIKLINEVAEKDRTWLGLKNGDHKIVDAYYFPPLDTQEYHIKIAKNEPETQKEDSTIVPFEEGRKEEPKQEISEQKIQEEVKDYVPRYLQTRINIVRLTGPDVQSIIESAKKDFMSDWLLNHVIGFYKKHISGTDEINEQLILSPLKNQDLVRVRGVYSYYLHRKLGFSYPQIGRKLLNLDTGKPRDHTTILGVVRKIEKMMENDPRFKEEVQKLWENANIEFEKYVKETNKQILSGSLQ